MKKTKILHTKSDPQKNPHRFLLRRGNDFYRIADLQIIDELGDKLSLYLKPPLEHLYKSRKPNGKVNLITGGVVDVRLNNDITRGVSCFNPYASWHSSGRAHVNGYSTRNLEREVILKDSLAITSSDIGVSPHIIFTVAFPLNTLSYVRTIPPPDDFGANYFEVSSNPYRQTVMDKVGTLHYVLDIADLRSGSVVMDVLVHNREAEFDFENNHPYPCSSEMYFVAPPLKIAPDNSFCPAVTVFFYQPMNSGGLEVIEKQPTTVWSRSKGALEDIFFQYEPF